MVEVLSDFAAQIIVYSLAMKQHLQGFNLAAPLLISRVFEAHIKN